MKLFTIIFLICFPGVLHVTGLTSFNVSMNIFWISMGILLLIVFIPTNSRAPIQDTRTQDHISEIAMMERIKFFRANQHLYQSVTEIKKDR
jgi:hypothetical protein